LFSPNASGNYNIEVNGEEKKVEFISGFAELNEEIDLTGKLMFLKYDSEGGKEQKLYHVAKQSDGGIRVAKIPLWLSVIPPLLAIFLALIFKEVILSLFIGIWSGAFIAGGLRFSSFYYWFQWNGSDYFQKWRDGWSGKKPFEICKVGSLYAIYNLAIRCCYFL